MKKHFVFGLGSGRHGTASLAHLLNSQMYAYISHEGLEYNLPYSGGEIRVILEPQPGIHRARSRALQEARGDFEAWT